MSHNDSDVKLYAQTTGRLRPILSTVIVKAKMVPRLTHLDWEISGKHHLGVKSPHDRIKLPRKGSLSPAILKKSKSDPSACLSVHRTAHVHVEYVEIIARPPRS